MAINYIATVEGESGWWVVRAYATDVDVDHKCVYTWVASNLPVAHRLAKAITAGVVLYDAYLETDDNGQTFVGAHSKVLGRMMNADLRRLGF